MRALSPRTQLQYHRVLIRAFGREPSETDHIPDVTAWSESNRRVLRAAIRSYWMERGQEVLGNAWAEALPARYEIARRGRFLTETELKAFERAMRRLKTRDQVLLRLLLKTGLRSDELLKLSHAAVTRALSSGELIFVAKGGRERALPIKHASEELETLLMLPAAQPHRIEAQTEKRPWEVVGQTLSIGSAETRYNLLLRLVKSCAKLAGIGEDGVSPHKMRHGFATRLIRLGAPLPIVQKALGHRFATTTQRYIHVETSDVARWLK